MKKLLLATGAVALLSGVSLMAVANPVAPTARADRSSMVQEDDDIAKQVKKCSMCHGNELEGKGKVPAIAGHAKADLLKSLNDPPKPMIAVAKTLSPEDKEKVAEHISKLPKPAK